MSKKNKKVIELSSFEDYDKEIKKLALQKSLLLDEHLLSKDVDKIVKASSYLKNIEKNDNKTGNLKAFFFSPDNEFSNGLGYKTTVKGLTFDMLRKMGKTPFINSIISTRIEQIKRFTKFTTDSQKEGWTIKRKVSPFEEETYKINDKDKRVIEKIAQFLQDGGENNKWDLNDDFEDFIVKFVRDSLELDACAAEIERNRGGKVVSYMSTDASMIRFLETIDPAKRSEFHYEEVNGYLPIYCQIYNNQILKNPVTQDEIIYYPWELCYGIRNRFTNIRNNGYGTSELEILVEIVTWLLWGMQYNGNFFKNGGMPKGYFTLPEAGGDVDQNALNEFRSYWRDTMVGVQGAHKIPFFNQPVEWNSMMSCLVGETDVITPIGKRTLSQLLGDSQEVFSKLWDGKYFTDARIYRTDKKRICKLILHNRLEIESSPDHRFLVLRNNEPTWIERKDVTLNDYVFVNKNVVDGEQEPLLYKGKVVEDDLYELLGWITGDGFISPDINSKRYLRTYYHPEKELDIIDYHLSILSKYGINGIRYTKKMDCNRKEYTKLRYGVNSSYDEYPYIHISDADFHRWALSIGVTSSKDKKNIPDFLYSAKSEFRCAFLRGFFSADGHISINGSRISITISNQNLKEQTRLLLMMEGIRCSSFKLKPTYTGISLAEDNILLVKDRDIYFKKIGFIQQYKKDREKVRQRSIYKEQDAPIEFIRNLALSIKEFNKTLSKEKKLSTSELKDLLNISRGYQHGSLNKVLYYGEKIGFVAPEFLKDFNLVPVIELIETDEYVEMCDVEVFNENHQFCANGIIVHNSNKEMEYARWVELLTIIACSVYHIDPSELGFRLEFQKETFGQQGQKERIQHSKDKGLTPLLVFLSKQINKYLVSELDENYQFFWTGLDIENETQLLDNDIKKLNGGLVSLEDAFQKYNDRPLNKEKDTILNPIYNQIKQAAMYGGQESNQAVDKMNGEENDNPFTQEDNPIGKAVQDYLNKAF